MNAGTAMSPADILDRAADEIQRRGLAHGKYIDGLGRVCAIGAMRIVSGQAAHCDGSQLPCLGVVGEAHTALRRFVSAPVIVWNDDSDAATVTSTMRACAAVLRAQAATEPVTTPESVTA